MTKHQWPTRSAEEPPLTKLEESKGYKRMEKREGEWPREKPPQPTTMATGKIMDQEGYPMEEVLP